MPRRWNNTRPRTTGQKIKREKVAGAALVPVIVWLATRFGIHLDADTASLISGLVLAAATVWARSRVTPVDDPQLPGDPSARTRANANRKGIL